jgi:hypothetical protein
MKMIRKMIRAVPVVALLAVSVAHAGNPANVVAAQVPGASEQVRSIDAKTQEVLELRKQVEDLQKSLSEVRSEFNHVPQYLDQGGGPVTGS